jgi:hypothetical protein
LGSLLLLTADPSRGAAWATTGAAVLGLGMGFSNTTFVVAVQTSVGWGQRGAVTSANMFMRTVGQSVGTGLFGAVFNLGVAEQISRAGSEINRLLDPASRASLGGAEVARLSAAIGTSMFNVYLIAGLLAIGLFVLAFRIPSGLSPVRQSSAD